MIYGLDLSYWQLSWRGHLAALAGIDFVFLRASVGTAYTDPRYAEFATQATQNAIIHGGYHFFKPSLSPELQAEKLWTSVGEQIPPCGFAIDVEEYTYLSDRQQRIGRFQSRLAELSGCEARFYSNASVINACYPWPWLRKYKVWIASYRAYSGPVMPAILHPEAWDIWQYSGSGDGPTHGTGSPKVDYDVARSLPLPIPAQSAKPAVRTTTIEEPALAPVLSSTWCAAMNRTHASERGRV